MPSSAVSTSARISWSLVTHHLKLGKQVTAAGLRRRLARLEKPLQPYPAQALHLHIVLDRPGERSRYTAALTLRLPGGIVHRKHAAPGVLKAFDTALDSLGKELSVQKLPAPAREGVFPPVRFATAPLTGDAAVTSLADQVQDVLTHHYARLLRYVRRQLWHDISAGELPTGAMDARSVVDEAARQALAEPAKKPERRGYLLWLFALTRRELARRRRQFKTLNAATLSLEGLRKLPELDEESEGYDAEQPLDIIERQETATRAEARELLPDEKAVSPADSASHGDLLAEARRAASRWPGDERDVFELYFVEGFDPNEVAVVTARPIHQVNEMIAMLNTRLREALREQGRV